MENKSLDMGDDDHNADDVVSQCLSLIEVAELQYIPELITDLSLMDRAFSKNKKDYKVLKADILDKRDNLVLQINKIAEKKLHEAGRLKKENKKKFQQHKAYLEDHSRQIMKEVQELKDKLNEKETNVSNKDLFELPEPSQIPTLKKGFLDKKMEKSPEEIFGCISVKEEPIVSRRSGESKMTRNDVNNPNNSRDIPGDLEKSTTTSNAKPKKPEVVYVQESAKENQVSAAPEPKISLPRPLSPVVLHEPDSPDMLPRVGGILFDSTAKTHIHTLYAKNGMGYVWCFKDAAATIIGRDTEPMQTFGIFGVKNVLDVTLSVPDGRVWLCAEDCYIYMITEQGSCQTKFKAKEDPACLAVKNDQVFVGTTSGILVYSMRGALITTALTDECKKITKLSVCENYEKLLVTCEFKIFVLNSDLETIFSYPDGRDKYILRKFSAAVFDYVGNIIATDVNNKTLILINSEGEFVKTLVRKGDDETPLCISAYDKGYLWAGYQSPVMPETAVIEIFKYK